jgi:hypothetical protein
MKNPSRLPWWLGLVDLALVLVAVCAIWGALSLVVL